MKKYPEIVELNEKSKLKYKIGEENRNVLKENNEVFETVHNYMSHDFYLPSRKESNRVVRFYGFPTDESPYCLASYLTTLSEDSVLGISVGSNIDEAINRLLSYGYRKSGNIFAKGVVKIELESKAKCDYNFNFKNAHNLLNEQEKALLNKITSIEISLESKCLGSRLY